MATKEDTTVSAETAARAKILRDLGDELREQSRRLAATGKEIAVERRLGKQIRDYLDSACLVSHKQYRPLAIQTYSVATA